MSAGQVIAGGCVSCTVTVKPHVLTLPQASVAVQLTSVVPSANVLPAAGEHATVGFGVHTSDEPTVKFTTALQAFASVPCVIFAGQLIAGGVVSTTSMVCVQLLC